MEEGERRQMREGASEGEGERGTDGREGERGGEDADASPASQREADRGEQGEKKRKENEKEGKDQGNMGEREGRSWSEGACVKVAVREGASLIPRASYQTVSRLQQLLSAQNTQALPFQLKGSLTKSEEEKKNTLPAESWSPSSTRGSSAGPPSPRVPITPSPGCPHSTGSKEFAEEKGGCRVRVVPSPAPGSLADFGVQPPGSALPASPGDGARRRGEGLGGKGPPGRLEVAGQRSSFPSRQHSAVSAHELLPQPMVDGQTDSSASPRSQGDAHTSSGQLRHGP